MARINFNWRSNANGARDGASITLRIGAASVCATIVRPVAGDELAYGASLLEYLSGRGLTVSVAPAARLGFALAAAVGNVRFVEGWRWLRDPVNVRNARETSLWFTRELVGWRWRTEPVERSAYRRNTPTDGFATWERVLLGERTVREVHRYTRDVVVPMPEGDYVATATVTVDEEVRARVPAWVRELAPKFVRSTVIHTKRTIAAPGCLFGGLTAHSYEGDDPEAAARSFVEAVETRRAKHPTWALELRMRASGDDTWEAYHHASGEWRAWGVAKREALPKEARIEATLPCSDDAIARVLAPAAYGVEVSAVRKRLGRNALENIATLAANVGSAVEQVAAAAQVEVARVRVEAQAKIAALGPNASTEAVADVLTKAAVPVTEELSWQSVAALGGMMLCGGYSMIAAYSANVGRL